MIYYTILYYTILYFIAHLMGNTRAVTDEKILSLSLSAFARSPAGKRLCQPLLSGTRALKLRLRVKLSTLLGSHGLCTASGAELSASQVPPRVRQVGDGPESCRKRLQAAWTFGIVSHEASPLTAFAVLDSHVLCKGLG